MLTTSNPQMILAEAATAVAVRPCSPSFGPKIVLALSGTCAR